MDDYRAAGVAIIWHIFPKLKQVHVYRDKGKKMEVFTGKEICSAEPVIKDFKISVEAIFNKTL